LQNRASDRAERNRTVRFHRNESGMRQLPVRRVGDDAKRGKRQPMGGGDARGNVGLRIGGMGAGFVMQGALFRAPGHGRIDPGDVGNRHAAERAGKPPRPPRIGIIARAVLGDDRARDKLCARRQSRHQAARDAKTDDRRSLPRDRRMQGPRETQGIAGARDGEDARPGDEERFRLEAGDGDKPWASHIPT